MVRVTPLLKQVDDKTQYKSNVNNNDHNNNSNNNNNYYYYYIIIIVIIIILNGYHTCNLQTLHVLTILKDLNYSKTFS